jgi:DNA-binding NtrC family response regulator
LTKHKKILIIDDEAYIRRILELKIKNNGKTLCEKTNPIKEKRPFLTIIVTARINPEERDWIAQMRDTIFMEKPFSPNKIVDTIEKYLKGQE